MGERGRPRSFDREQALRAAMFAFWERGYEATSISDLASVMGINPPSLYAAFGDKQSLFRSAVELYGDNEGSIARHALAEQATARAVVEAMLRDSVERFTDRNTPRGCMVVLAATNCTAENAAVQRFAAELRRRDERALRDRLTRAIVEGDLPDRADPAQLAAYYHTVLYGLSVQARDGVSSADLHGIVDHALASWPA